MKVKMRTLMSGPEGTFAPGQTIDVSEGEGKQLIEAGYAEKVIIPAKQDKKESETASIEPDEKAVKPSPKRKKPDSKEEE